MTTVTVADMERTQADTRDHISKVQRAIAEMQAHIDNRAAFHDRSKLEEPEASGLAALQANLRTIEYGTPAYQAALEAARPFLDHHYAANTHHPEHYPDGVAGMSLLDVLEMFCDWYAAGQRTKDGSLARSLDVNIGRFGIDSQLAAILRNTRKEMGWK